MEKYSNNLFEDIKHMNEDGVEFWYARELMKVLGYTKWKNFEGVIIKAIKACKNSNANTLDHFAEAGKMVQIGSGANRIQKDYKLTRYSCYLIAQNGDPHKETIALAQTYFAIQTRRQEITEKEYSMLTEDEKRFYQRDLTRKGNYSLNIAAKNVGVKNFDKFHNSGYKGLYNVRRDKVQTEKEANDAHYNVGKNIREVIKKNSGILPEELPTPEKSLKQLEKEYKNSPKRI